MVITGICFLWMANQRLTRMRAVSLATIAMSGFHSSPSVEFHNAHSLIPRSAHFYTMSKFFINRPIVAMVISIITVIVGLVTLFTLPIAQFPKIIPPEIFVEAHYVGADARTIYEVL